MYKKTISRFHIRTDGADHLWLSRPPALRRSPRFIWQFVFHFICGWAVYYSLSFGMIVICGPPWDSCLALSRKWNTKEIEWRCGRVCDQPDRSRRKFEIHLVWPKNNSGSLYSISSPGPSHNRAFCMFCSNVGRNIIILTLSHTVVSGNELSKFTVIGIYIMIDDMRACKNKTRFLRPSYTKFLLHCFWQYSFCGMFALQEWGIIIEMPFFRGLI